MGFASLASTKKPANFISCALYSELVQLEDIEAAKRELVTAFQAQGRDLASAEEKDLAEKLIEMDLLNRWQADQMLEGHWDFRLGPYKLIDSLGYGGMGQVFKAEHTIMGRVVAVKVLPRSKSTPDAIANFHREVRMQAQLDHENLVRAHDAGFDKQVHFLVTEYVPGTDLRKLVRREGRLGMTAAASIMMQAARGLEYAHKRNLLHRDIKPGNILVTPDGKAKVSDLGLASFFTEDRVDDPRRNKVVGTADYTAPEQIATPGSATVSSDIYSLGCTLYYAVTGKVPFPGGTHREKWKAHRTKNPLDPRRLNPELSAEFCKFIEFLMAKQPEKRPANATEVARLCMTWIDESSPLIAHEAAEPNAAYRSAAGFESSDSSLHLSGSSPSWARELYDSDSEESSQISSGRVSATPSIEEDLSSLSDEEFTIPPALFALILIGGVVMLMAMAALIANTLMGF